MGFEIDFLPVGDESQSGDAITIRYGDLYSDQTNQKIIVIDSGFQGTGEQIVSHLINNYNTKKIDLVIVTHPDQDHCCGLLEVLENFEVKELWMHRPWKHSSEIIEYIIDKRWTIDGLRKNIIENYPYAYDIEQLALKKAIKIIEPFEGTVYDSGVINILSPSYSWYLLYLLNFDSTPEPIDKYKLPKKSISSFFKKAINFVQETWDNEKLTDPNPGDTSAENESSSIVYFNYEDKKILLTADAGVLALNNMINYSARVGIDLSNLNIIQIPHHGSKHNIGPTILNKLIGDKSSSENMNRFFAIASVAKNSDIKHPSRRVTNAFKRRGCTPYKTNGTGLIYSCNSKRVGIPVDPIPFYSIVEDD
jgi:beta-lactamase superfamily II metal-dependent hydrolase